MGHNLILKMPSIICIQNWLLLQKVGGSHGAVFVKGINENRNFEMLCLTFSSVQKLLLVVSTAY